MSQGKGAVQKDIRAFLVGAAQEPATRRRSASSDRQRRAGGASCRQPSAAGPCCTGGSGRRACTQRLPGCSYAAGSAAAGRSAGRAAAGLHASSCRAGRASAASAAAAAAACKHAGCRRRWQQRHARQRGSRWGCRCGRPGSTSTSGRSSSSSGGGGGRSRGAQREWRGRRQRQWQPQRQQSGRRPHSVRAGAAGPHPPQPGGALFFVAAVASLPLSESKQHTSCRTAATRRCALRCCPVPILSSVLHFSGTCWPQGSVLAVRLCGECGPSLPCPPPVPARRGWLPSLPASRA